MMKHYKRLVWFLAIAMIFIAGCSSTPVKKGLIFDALVLENKSLSELENVRIEVRQTGAFASCGVILRARSCSTTFRAQVYQGNSVYISWQSHGQKHYIGPLHVELPETIKHDTLASIVISVMPENRLTAKFIYR